MGSDVGGSFTAGVGGDAGGSVTAGVGDVVDNINGGVSKILFVSFSIMMK